MAIQWKRTKWYWNKITRIFSNILRYSRACSLPWGLNEGQFIRGYWRQNGRRCWWLHARHIWHSFDNSRDGLFWIIYKRLEMLVQISVLWNNKGKFKMDWIYFYKYWKNSCSCYPKMIINLYSYILIYLRLKLIKIS